MSARTLEELRDPAAVARQLREKGFNDASASGKAAIFATAAEALIAGGRGAGERVHAFFVPGRIEVLGKHTDYAGGRSVITAADRGCCLIAAPGGDDEVLMTDVAWNEDCRFRIGPELAPTSGHWGNYPMTVARRLARNFPPSLRGADIAFGSDLPAASGMSSSSAMLVASYMALAAINELDRTEIYRRHIDSQETLAEYLGTIENGQSFGQLIGDKGVGTFGGSEDHTAILCSRSGTLSQYSYCPVRFERRIPVPGGYVFAVASSGVKAEKTGEAMAKYNRASALAKAVAAAWRSATGGGEPHMAAAIAAGSSAVERLRTILRKTGGGEFSAAQLLARFEHFLAENEQIIPAAGDALAAVDMAEFGRQVDLSQRGAEALLGNQVPETVDLARSARELGAVAASAFGAGFGGSVWALTSLQAAEEFCRRWAADYARRFPDPASRSKFFLTHSGPAATAL